MVEDKIFNMKKALFCLIILLGCTYTLYKIIKVEGEKIGVTDKPIFSKEVEKKYCYEFYQVPVMCRI